VLHMLGTRLRSVLERSLDPPHFLWILLGFFLSYFFCFLLPVFFSAPAMQFYQYVPAVSPIGVDLRQVLNSTKSWLAGGSPYFQYNLYPPLTYLLLRPVLAIPYEMRYGVVTLISLLSYVWMTLALPLTLGKLKQGWGVLMLVLVTGSLSYGLQFEIERGQFNVIAACLALLAVWIFHRRPRLRILAYVLLCLSVQLKLYPLIFVILLIDDWQAWRDNIRRVLLIAAANIALLFVLGGRVCLEFLRAIVVQSQSRNWIWVGDHSIQSFVAMAMDRASQRGWLWLIPYQEWIKFGLMAATAACIVLIAWKAYRQRRRGLDSHLLMACAIGASLLPSISNDYELSILAAPVAMLLVEVIEFGAEPDGQWPARGLAALCILAFSAAYSSTLFSFAQKPSELIVANACPALLTMLGAVTVLSLTRRSPDADGVT
jgi:hypothetical protein